MMKGSTCSSPPPPVRAARVDSPESCWVCRPGGKQISPPLLASHEPPQCPAGAALPLPCSPALGPDQPGVQPPPSVLLCIGWPDLAPVPPSEQRRGPQLRLTFLGPRLPLRALPAPLSFPTIALWVSHSQAALSLSFSSLPVPWICQSAPRAALGHPHPRVCLRELVSPEALGE